MADAFNCTTIDDCSYVECGGKDGLDFAECTDGMCHCAKRASFFIGVGIYIGLLIFIAIYSYGKSVGSAVLGNSHADGEQDGGVRVVSETSKLRDHFMASGSFGSAVMALTIFSTAFSGYTVVGVPEEASINGFVALRWLSIGVAVNIGLLIFYPRIRRVGVVRCYNAPTDILVDRFNSNRLRLLSSLVLVVPLFIYTTVQFKAMGDIIEGLSLGRVPKVPAVAMLCVVIVFCEIVGGQRSVTLSDAVQALIMLSAFMVMPFVVLHFYGSLSDVVEAYDGDQLRGDCLAFTRPWSVMTPTVFGSCDFDERFSDPNCFSSRYDVANETALPYLNPQIVGRATIDPDTRTPFQHTTLSLAMFVFNALAFPLNPHVMQKAFVASSDEVLKRSLMIVALGAMVVNLPSLYYGVVKAAKLNDATASAFPAVTGELIDQGGFAEFIAVVASCSALAAIMSTCDSCIIGANNVLTVDWIKNFLWKSASPRQISMVSKVFTPVFAVGAMVFSFNTENINFGTLLNLQNSFVWQVLPSFFVACYTDRVAAVPLLYGQVAGLVLCIILEISIALEGIDDTDHGEDYYRFKVDTILPSGLWGVMLNLSVVVATQYYFNKTGSANASDDTRKNDTVDPNVMREFGDHRLTVITIDAEIMHTTTEPLKIKRNRYILASVVVLFLLSLPWYEAPYTQQPVVAGIPQWAGGFFFAYLIEMALVSYVLWTWITDPMTELKDDPNDTSVSDLGDDAEENEEIVRGGLEFDVASPGVDISDAGGLISNESSDA